MAKASLLSIFVFTMMWSCVGEPLVRDNDAGMGPSDATARDADGVDTGPTDLGGADAGAVDAGGPTDSGAEADSGAVTSIAVRFLNLTTGTVDPRFTDLPGQLSQVQLLPQVGFRVEAEGADRVVLEVNGTSFMAERPPFDLLADAPWTPTEGNQTLRVQAFSGGTMLMEKSYTMMLSASGAPSATGEHSVHPMWITQNGATVRRDGNDDFVDENGQVVLRADEVTPTRAELAELSRRLEEVRLETVASASDAIAFAFTVLLPEGFDPTVPYPLVVFLHHGFNGYRGSDNDLLPLDAPLFAGDRSLRAGSWAARYPAIILLPQLLRVEVRGDLNLEWAAFVEPAGGGFSNAPDPSPSAARVRTLVDRLLARQLVVDGQRPTVDRQRVYLTGHSMGGLGTWDWLSRWPDIYAGGLTSAGFGDVGAAGSLAQTPVWAFTHALDCANPSSGIVRLAEAVRAEGGTVRHSVLTQQPEDRGNDPCLDAHFQLPERVWSEPTPQPGGADMGPGALEWLFSQVAPAP